MISSPFQLPEPVQKVYRDVSTTNQGSSDEIIRVVRHQNSVKDIIYAGLVEEMRKLKVIANEAERGVVAADWDVKTLKYQLAELEETIDDLRVELQDKDKKINELEVERQEMVEDSVVDLRSQLQYMGEEINELRKKRKRERENHKFEQSKLHLELDLRDEKIKALEKKLLESRKGSAKTNVKADVKADVKGMAKGPDFSKLFG